MIDRRTMLGMALALLPAAACSRPANAAEITVYKSPSCGCCSKWVEKVQASGFAVAIHDMEDVSPIARKAGVPDEARSCHTALVDGYFVEGHVSPADVRKLLKERPQARGIAVPGMPIGSPGMEQGDSKQAYETMIVGSDGAMRVFARHNSSTAG